MLYLSMNEKRKPGRPVLNIPVMDKAKGYTISLTPNEHQKLVSKYGSISEVLKNLAKDIPDNK